MATTIKATQYNGVQGGWIERGTVTLTPAGTATITANAEIECTTDTNISGNTGDQIFVNPINLTTGLVPKGARFTANGTVKVKIANVTGSNITDSTATTYDYILIHYS